MARVIVSGEPGETFTNDTGKVKYQFLCDWKNTCGLCAQYDHQVGSTWPIPLHRSCRCKQIAIWPGDTSRPFTDFREKIESLPDDQKAKVVGVANLKLIESGVVDWGDVVTGQRVRDLQEVVALKKLSVDAMTKAGVGSGVANRAYETVHTPAHELAAQKRAELIGKVLAKGVQKDDLRKALAEKLAGRVGIASGPSGPSVPKSPPPPPPPPAPKSKSKPKTMPPAPVPPPVPLGASERADYLLKAKVDAEVAARLAREEAEAARVKAAAEAEARAAEKAKALAEQKAAHEARLASLAAAKVKAEAEAAAKAAPAAWSPRKQSDFREIGSAKDMEAFGRESFGAWADSLTQQDKNAVKLYAADNYKWMNAILRGADPKTLDLPGGLSPEGARAYIARTVAPLAKGTVDRDIVTFRGVKDLDAMKLDPAKLVKGQEITAAGFFSATLKKDKANDFAVGNVGDGSTAARAILQINTPKGSTGAYLNAAELSGYSDERELLMPPGAKLRFVREGGTYKDVWGHETPVLVFERVE